MLEIEIWEYVYLKGNKTKYMVSIMGRVKNSKTNKILQPAIDGGYLKVGLYHKGKMYTRKVHRLVSEAFIDNIDPYVKNEVNHIDGNKTNNNIDNLEWVSRKENIRHAFKIGLNHGFKGIKNYFAVHDEEIIHRICSLLEEGYRIKEISKKTKVNKHTIHKIYKRKQWKHISINYDF